MSVRSRLIASAVAFLLGFGIANIGLIFIEHPDQIVWIIAGVVFMVTGALGVLVSDSRRRFSLWAVLGFELAIVLIGVPVLWLLSLAVSESANPSLWPTDPDWHRFVQAWTAGKQAAWNTVIVTAPATGVGCVLGALAAVATVRQNLAGRRAAVWVLLGAVFMPAFALAGPMAAQAYVFGAHDRWWLLSVCALLITVPLSWWLFDRVAAGMPWTLRDALIVDGVPLAHRIWFFWVRALLPRVLGVVAIVFMVAATDSALSLALTATDQAQTLPAQLAMVPEPSESIIAAIALWWLLPAFVVAAVFNRIITEVFAVPERGVLSAQSRGRSR